MKVAVFSVVRGVSITYAMTVGKEEARVERRILPLADQTKTSICPGVSINMCCGRRAVSDVADAGVTVEVAGSEVDAVDLGGKHLFSSIPIT